MPQQEAVEGFQALLATGALLRGRIRACIHSPAKALPFLQEGRLVQLLASSQPTPPGAASAATAETSELMIQG